MCTTVNLHLSLMEVSGHAKGICRYARENFNRLVTVRDINSLSRKFRLMNRRNDIVRVKELLREQGSLRLLKRDSAICIFRTSLYGLLSGEIL